MVKIPGTSSMEGMKKGAWTAEEDQILKDHVRNHGKGKWNTISRKTDLKRSGKSCRLRWLNYLRPDIKRGDFSEDEEDLIIRLHKLLGNRWCLIAGRLPGRTDNEIKNYWNTTLRKKLAEEENYSKQSKEDIILINSTETVASCSKETKPATTTNNDLQINASWDSVENVNYKQQIGSTSVFLQGIHFTDYEEDKFLTVSSFSDQTPLFSDELLGSWLADQDNFNFELVQDS
ncbi:hypothetical protein SLA2020_007470 [Shorea laevis]